MVSGSTTSRTNCPARACCAWRFSRSRWRRSAASDGVAALDHLAVAVQDHAAARALAARSRRGARRPCSRSASLPLLPLILGRGASPGLAGAARGRRRLGPLGRPDRGRPPAPTSPSASRRLRCSSSSLASSRAAVSSALLARLLLGRLARLFLGLPLDRRLFLGLAAGGVLGLALGVRLGAPARFLLGALGVGERAHPGALFLVGERLQDHAAARRRAVVAAGRRAGRRLGARLAAPRPAGAARRLGRGLPAAARPATSAAACA